MQQIHNKQNISGFKINWSLLLFCGVKKKMLEYVFVFSIDVDKY